MRRYLSSSQYFSLSVGLFAITSYAWASPSLEVDDAEITEAKSCQLEAWAEYGRDRNIHWLMPACNPTGNLEFAVAAGYEAYKEDYDTKAFAFEAKTMLAEELGDYVSIAFSAGFENYRTEGEDEQEWYVNLPVTTFFSERFAWYKDIGAVYEKEEKHTTFTWGTGFEFGLTDRVDLYGEVFGDSNERPYYQVLAALWLKPDQIQVSLGFGDKIEGSKDERFVSLGLHIIDLGL